MKPSTKDRIKVGIPIILFLFVVMITWYGCFARKYEGGMYTSAMELVDTNTSFEDLNNLFKYHNGYVLKQQEGDKYYLKYSTYSSSENLYSQKKYELTKKQYDELSVGESYYFNISFYRKNATRDGVVKKIYTDNPIQN